MERLEQTGLVYTNSQTVFASDAMLVLKGDSDRLVTDNREVNQKLGVVPSARPKLMQVT